MAELYEVTVYLKSGQSFTFDSTHVTTTRSTSTNELTGLKWSTPDDTTNRTYRRLPYIRLDDISAITAKATPIE